MSNTEGKFINDPNEHKITTTVERQNLNVRVSALYCIQHY